MKKLMVVAAVALAAVASQAAQIKWVSTGSVLGVDTATVGDNGSYVATGANMKGNSALTFVMTFFEAGTKNVAGTWEGEMKYKATGDKNINNSWADGGANTLKQGTAYDYSIVVSGTQSDLQALGIKGDYDYSAATVSAMLDGSFTTEASGATQITKDIGSWTVAGVKSAGPTPPVTPEPTSGLLLLIGMAGLALRRRHA